MKIVLRMLLFGALMVFATSCATHRLEIARARAVPPPPESTSVQEVSIARVKQEMREGHFEFAAQLLDTISEESENAVEIHLCKGLLYQYQNRLLSALNEYRECQRLMSTDSDRDMQIDVPENMGRIYRHLNDYENAASCFRKCRQLSTEDSYSKEIRFLEQFQGIPYEIEGPGHTVDLKMDSYRGLPMIRATVNDGMDVNFIVDTGASMSVLSSDMAKRLKIEPLLSGIRGRGTGGNFPAALAEIDSLKLGDVVVRNVPVAIIDSQQLTFKLFGLLTLLRIDGIIGLPLLRQLDVNFVYKDERLVLTVPQMRDEPSSFEGNFYLVDGRMLVSAGINGVGPFTFLLDTGGDTDCRITPGCLAELEGRSVQASKGRGELSWGAGGGGVKKLRQVEDATLTLCGFDIGNVDLIVDSGLAQSVKKLPVRVDGLIGMKILENFNVEIDFRNMQLDLVNGDQSGN